MSQRILDSPLVYFDTLYLHSKPSNENRPQVNKRFSFFSFFFFFSISFITLSKLSRKFMILLQKLEEKIE